MANVINQLESKRLHASGKSLDTSYPSQQYNIIDSPRTQVTPHISESKIFVIIPANLIYTLLIIPTTNMQGPAGQLPFNQVTNLRINFSKLK